MKANKLPEYSTKLFCDIYDNADDFASDYNTIGLGGLKTDTQNKLIKQLFYLLYGKYGNNPIANYDVEQFKFKLFGVVFMYGPAWEKRLEIQKELRDTNLSTLQEGATAIYNHAYNPSTDPTTQTTTELNYINEQNVTKYKASKIDTMNKIWELLNTDVTNAFLGKFIVCFKKFVQPANTYIYETDLVEDEDEE